MDENEHAKLLAAAKHKNDMSMVEQKEIFKRLKGKNLRDKEAAHGGIVDKINSMSCNTYQSLLKALWTTSCSTLETIFHLADEKVEITPLILARSVVETSSTALWLCTLMPLEEAAYKTMETVYADLDQTKKAYDALSGPRSRPSFDKMMTILKEAKGQLQVHQGKNFASRLQYCKIVQQADEVFLGRGGKRQFGSGEAAWRICSGVTHAADLDLGNIPRSLDGNGIVGLMSAPRVSDLALFLSPATENLEMFADIYLDQCGKC